jgi:hypothetical protein
LRPDSSIGTETYAKPSMTAREGEKK